MNAIDTAASIYASSVTTYGNVISFSYNPYVNQQTAVATTALSALKPGALYCSVLVFPNAIENCRDVYAS